MPIQRLKICGDCPRSHFRTLCHETNHFCRAGHYSYETGLPIEGGCPDFPKQRNKVPGEVLKTARELKDKPVEAVEV